MWLDCLKDLCLLNLDLSFSWLFCFTCFLPCASGHTSLCTCGSQEGHLRLIHDLNGSLNIELARSRQTIVHSRLVVSPKLFWISRSFRYSNSRYEKLSSAFRRWFRQSSLEWRFQFAPQNHFRSRTTVVQFTTHARSVSWRACASRVRVEGPPVPQPRRSRCQKFRCTSKK